MTDFLDLKMNLMKHKYDSSFSGLYQRIENLLNGIISGEYLLLYKDELIQDLQDIIVTADDKCDSIKFKTEFNLRCVQNVDRNFFINMSEEERKRMIDDVKNRLKEQFIYYMCDKYGVTRL